MIEPVTGTESSTPLTTGPKACAPHRITMASARAAASLKRSSRGGVAGGLAAARGAGIRLKAATSETAAGARGRPGGRGGVATTTAIAAHVVPAEPSAADPQRPRHA